MSRIRSLKALKSFDRTRILNSNRYEIPHKVFFSNREYSCLLSFFSSHAQCKLLTKINRQTFREFSHILYIYRNRPLCLHFNACPTEVLVVWCFLILYIKSRRQQHWSALQIQKDEDLKIAHLYQRTLSTMSMVLDHQGSNVGGSRSWVYC